MYVANAGRITKLPLTRRGETASRAVNAAKLDGILADHADRDLVKYLISGFCFGFSVGYEGPFIFQRTGNAKSALENSEAVTKVISKAVEAGYGKGPFLSSP